MNWRMDGDGWLLEDESGKPLGYLRHTGEHYEWSAGGRTGTEKDFRKAQQQAQNAAGGKR